MDIQRRRREAFRDLLDPREAMTVAVRVQISPSVVDTRFVAVTQRAAELFGYQDPAELEGKFTSTVHVLEDLQRTRLRSTLRALGLAESFEHYEVRIVQSSGAIKRVIKQVEQRQIDEAMVWICRLELADTREPFHPPPLPETLPEDALHHFFGWACVAEVEALLQHRRLLLTSIHDMDIFSHDKTSTTAGSTRGPVTSDHVVERLTLNSPRVYYKFHCLVCERDWIGGGKDEEHTDTRAIPRRCNYADCRASAWNDPVAAPAARRKRMQRLACHRPHASS
jgi:hypothetical protein